VVTVVLVEGRVRHATLATAGRSALASEAIMLKYRVCYVRSWDIGIWEELFQTKWNVEELGVERCRVIQQCLLLSRPKAEPSGTCILLGRLSRYSGNRG
jgi:hypothetical protein